MESSTGVVELELVSVELSAGRVELKSGVVELVKFGEDVILAARAAQAAGASSRLCNKKRRVNGSP